MYLHHNTRSWLNFIGNDWPQTTVTYSCLWKLSIRERCPLPIFPIQCRIYRNFVLRCRDISIWIARLPIPGLRLLSTIVVRKTCDQCFWRAYEKTQIFSTNVKFFSLPRYRRVKLYGIFVQQCRSPDLFFFAISPTFFDCALWFFCIICPRPCDFSTSNCDPPDSVIFHFSLLHFHPAGFYQLIEAVESIWILGFHLGHRDFFGALRSRFERGWFVFSTLGLLWL